MKGDLKRDFKAKDILEEESEQCKATRDILEKLILLEKEFPECRTITQFLTEVRKQLTKQQNIKIWEEI